MNRGQHLAALKETPQGVRLDLVVSPDAATASFPDRYDPWRDRIGIRVQQAAQNGRANREVVRLVARYFECPETEVRIMRGAKTSHKCVEIRGLSLQEAAQRLAGDLK